VHSNGWDASIHVMHSRVEQLQLQPPAHSVDILISEPMGTLLFNERMVRPSSRSLTPLIKTLTRFNSFQVESYLIARDRFLKFPPLCPLP
jgi:hypothetical protein